MRPHKIALHGQIEPDLFPEFVVVSEHMYSVIRTVQKIARFDANVLISGESGTGKELVARIIHQKSSRRNRPFVPVNCGILSGGLFESKLFGHEKGAFTGAVRQTRGRFEQAHNGTLFLDEVSEISLPNQVNFLRVLEDGCFCRIGGEIPIRVDVRIIAATNKDLATEVKAGRFRRDLYYRLKVIPINLLPLRKRKVAIPHLVNNFLERFAKLYKKPKASVSPDAMECLMSFDWPGNIRHLKNVVERMFLMAQGPLITVNDFPEDIMDVVAFDSGEEGSGQETHDPIASSFDFAAHGPVEPLRKARQRLEKTIIMRALEMTSGQRARAAELLEIKPRTLRQKMSDYSIKFRKTGKGGRAKL
ncbi:MAG: sigma-54-dependent Fis family transcriptional regulator [Deltaproteobacteria bacterium]|nr:sigma-54-dependent Fis family transcriptional regulator [Deltaproteobacteria bacterium]RKX58832.1 MAG: sigma-54-dependent Fis family transcriptional regulator [Thermodesulfobacteriota bacterium]MBW1946684.1 sigma-54-dependent Fis family transcriptional regulator [Deltaproteobacteria bacterium]MBW1966562.1 sigma-54-dependent Fis family transcriptional regulator [Deltaproteobacteria bacterium]MBW2098153.1 sigma-54-dependent Fis family transcriptional regulator [Deltaproteobacteria bacterium]